MQRPAKSLTGLVTQGVIPPVLLRFSPASQSLTRTDHSLALHRSKILWLPYICHPAKDTAKPRRGMGTRKRACDVAQRSGRRRQKKTIGTLSSRRHRTTPARTVRLATAAAHTGTKARPSQ
jgi:hypothetical protein